MHRALSSDTNDGSVRPWWSRGLGVRLVAFALVVDGGAAANASPEESIVDSEIETARSRFEAWADRIARHDGAGVWWIGDVELDGDPEPERAARLCMNDGWHERVLVEDGARRWSVDHASWGQSRVCLPSPGRPAWDDRTTALTLSDAGKDGTEVRTIGLRADGLVVLRERAYATSGEVAELDARWDIASVRATYRVPPTEVGPRWRHREGHVVTVRREPGLLPSAATSFLLGGWDVWDAEIAIAAERRPNGALLMRVELRDDEEHTGARGDRMQLWWGDPVRGFEVHDAMHGPDARWVSGDGPVPEVHGNVHAFEVMLPAPLDPTSGREGIPFTVRAVDVDDDGRAILATSRFDGRGQTMGLLRELPDGAELEAIGERLSDATDLDDLPLPPRPGSGPTLAVAPPSPMAPSTSSP